MPRPEKVQAVADIKERIENAQAVFLAEYAGLSVSQQQTLRRELKANGAEFKVIKMTLARLAAAELDIDTLDEHLLGPTGMAIADGDAVAAAKVLKDFSKANEVFQVKGGLLGLDYLSPERVSELADIEPREVLLARMAGLFAAPMGNVLALFESLQRDVVGLTQALVEKREASGEVAEPAAEAEPEEAAEVASGADDAVEPEAAADADVEPEADAPAEDSTAGDEADAAEDTTESVAETDADEASEANADEAEAAVDEVDSTDEDTAPSDEGEDQEDASSDEGDADKAEEE